MCGGGGGGGTIYQPDYNAYDKQFDLQRSAIESQINNSSMAMQQQLISKESSEKRMYYKRMRVE